MLYLLFPVSRSEISRVKKLFHQLDSDKKALVKLSKVTELPHLKNNVLAKLVASQFVKKKHDVTDHEEEHLDVDKFIELFDVLSPKKSVQSKLEGMAVFCFTIILVECYVNTGSLLNRIGTASNLDVVKCMGV